VRIEQAQVVKAPREQVFETWTDYERFSVLFTRVTVTERAGNTVHLDTEVKVMGRKVKRTEKHVLTPPDQVQVEARRRCDQHVRLEIRAGARGDPGDGGCRRPAQRVDQSLGTLCHAPAANLAPQGDASLRELRGREEAVGQLTWVAWFLVASTSIAQADSRRRLRRGILSFLPRDCCLTSALARPSLLAPLFRAGPPRPRQWAPPSRGRPLTNTKSPSPGLLVRDFAPTA
jgi:hypothetical protein